MLRRVKIFKLAINAWRNARLIEQESAAANAAVQPADDHRIPQRINLVPS